MHAHRFQHPRRRRRRGVWRVSPLSFVLLLLISRSQCPLASPAGKDIPREGITCGRRSIGCA
jgi:hypothetical protein